MGKHNDIFDALRWAVAGIVLLLEEVTDEPDEPEQPDYEQIAEDYPWAMAFAVDSNGKGYVYDISLRSLEEVGIWGGCNRHDHVGYYPHLADDWRDSLVDLRPYRKPEPVCPHCGSSDGFVVCGVVPGGWYYVCLGCAAHGPMADTPEGAAEKWNKRAGEHSATTETNE